MRSRWRVLHRPKASSRIAPPFRLAFEIRGRRLRPLRQDRSSIRRNAPGLWRLLCLRPEWARESHPAERREIARRRFRSLVQRLPARHRSAECRRDKFSEASRAFRAFSGKLLRFQTSGGFERTGGVRGTRDPGSNDLRRSEQSSTPSGPKRSVLYRGPIVTLRQAGPACPGTASRDQCSIQRGCPLSTSSRHKKCAADDARPRISLDRPDERTPSYQMRMRFSGAM